MTGSCRAFQSGALSSRPFCFRASVFAPKKTNMKAPIEQISRVETKSRIVVIEDEPAVSILLVKILKSHGFDVCAAATGTGGLRLIEEQNCDLILSDIDLPDIDGFEVCRRIKQNHKLRLIPIILLSGRLPEGNEALALKVGASDYMSKPFGVNAILSKITARLREAKKGP
jgi:DNA-binding response OmpR family regulator